MELARKNKFDLDYGNNIKMPPQIMQMQIYSQENGKCKKTHLSNANFVILNGVFEPNYKMSKHFILTNVVIVMNAFL